MCEKEIITGFWGRTLNKNDDLQDIDLDGTAILNFSSWNNLRGLLGVWCGVLGVGCGVLGVGCGVFGVGCGVWSGLIWIRTGTRGCSCECGNEPSAFKMCW